MTETAPPRGKPDLRVLGAELDAAAPPPPPDDPPKEPPRRRSGDIFRGCPVTALGVHGDTFFYLDILGQLAAVTNHTKDRMRGIFGGRKDLLMTAWPSYPKGSKTPNNWAQEDAATAMMRACAEKGVWNAFERVRGLGAWVDADGRPVLHCGDAILYGGAWRDPGEIEGYVYPSAPRIPRPLDPSEIGALDAAPAEELLGLLETWRWLRGDLDAWLLMGWICAAMFGGALDWRPLLWITGDKGTGKSTVQKVIRLVMGGEGAILQSTDATEASVRQFLMQSTIPVALDELEADADNRKSFAVIKLARQAASGGVVLRGGADHKGQEFKARSAFVFSSILVPPLLDQDISRIALLELEPLPRGDTSPSIDPRRWARVGRALRGRVVAQWSRLAATLELYRQALHEAGHDARGCDQFGTLLALADLAMHDELPDIARADGWARRLTAADVIDQTDQAADWQRMLNHLLGQHLEIIRAGQRYTLGRWILCAAAMRTTPDPLLARDSLPMYGLRVEGRGETARLVVANSNPNLAALFMGTHWYAAGGQKGVWSQAAKRIPGATATGARSFDGVSSRAWSFPLASIPNILDKERAGDDAGPDNVKADQTPVRANYNPDDFA